MYARVPDTESIAQTRVSLVTTNRSFITDVTGAPPLVSAPPLVRQQFLNSTLELVSASRGYSVIGTERRDAVWLLWGISGVVLFIACMNVATLLTAHQPARLAEIAIRMALGASVGRIARRLFVETSLLVIQSAANKGAELWPEKAPRATDPFCEPIDSGDAN